MSKSAPERRFSTHFDFYLFARLHLLSSTFPFLIYFLLPFSSMILSTSAFPSVHLGSLTSKFPSVISHPLRPLIIKKGTPRQTGLQERIDSILNQADWGGVLCIVGGRTIETMVLYYQSHALLFCPVMGENSFKSKSTGRPVLTLIVHPDLQQWTLTKSQIDTNNIWMVSNHQLHQTL